MVRPMINEAIIPAAGYGTRLLPITKILPKVMVPILTKPALQWVVDELVAAGIKKISIVIGWKGELIEEYYKTEPTEMLEWLSTRQRPDLIEYIKSIIPEDTEIFFEIQEILDGLAGAILRGSKYINSNNFVVSLGDNIIVEKKAGSLIEDMINIHESLDAAVTLAVAHVPIKDVSKFGVIAHKRKMLHKGITVYEVSELVEKPPIEKAPSNLAIIGRYILSSDALEYLRNAPIVNGEISETDGFYNMIKDGFRVVAVGLGNRYWHDIGSMEGYAKAFIRATLSKSPELKGFLQELIEDKF